MSGAFDPYYTWLGIPPDEQPPHFYRLLALRPFENNPDAVEHAADRIMMQLRGYQAGKHSNESQKLLNEVTRAKLCLLNPEKKAAYDAWLQERTASSASPEAWLEALLDSPTTEPMPPPPPRMRRSPQPPAGSQWPTWFWPTMVGAGALLVLGLGVLLGRIGRQGPENPPVALRVQSIGSTGRHRDEVSPGGEKLARHFAEPAPAPAPALDPSPAKPVAEPSPVKPAPEQAAGVAKPSEPGPMSDLKTAPAPVVAASKPAPPAPASPAVPVVAPAAPAAVPAPAAPPAPVTAPSPPPSAAPVAATPPAMPAPALSTAAPGTPAVPAPAPVAVPSPPPPTPPTPAAVPAPVAAPSAPAPGAATAVAPPIERKPEPSSEPQAAAKATIEEAFRKEYAQTGTAARLALAALLINRARQSRDKPEEQYVCLVEARNLAAREDDCALALLAIDELSKYFRVSGASQKLDLLDALVRRARKPSSVLWSLEACSVLEREVLGTEQFDGLVEFFRNLDLVALKKSLPQVVGLIQDKRKRLETLRSLSDEYHAAAEARAKDPNDGAAAARMGRVLGMIGENWTEALPLLASGDGPMAAAAAKLVAKADDPQARLDLADAWWDLATQERNSSPVRAMARQAAIHWYERALAGLTGEDLDRARSRIVVETPRKRSGKALPLTVALHGLGGQKAMTPGRATGAINPVGGFAAIGGRATIEYPALAVTCFVHEMEVVLPGAPQTFGYLNFRYGDPADCFGLYFTWDPAKRQFECHIGRSANGPIYPGASHYLQPGQRVPITVAVNEGLAWLMVDKTQVNAPTSAPSDLALQIDADQAAVGIARCELRPWGPADTARFGRAPVRKVACRWGETALRLHVRNQAIGDRPLPSATAPFAIAATGTAMQWVPAGSFARPNPASPRNEPTQVTISRGFWLSRYEITQAEWLALATRNPSRIGGSPFLPVECATWDDAAAWCSLLGQTESKAHRLPAGYEFRLPTEAEWEYAARAGAAADLATAADQFWHADNSGWRLHEVGEGQPNAWGLYDMHGNVSEWCCDGWQDINSTNPILRLTDPFFRNRDPRQTPYLVRGGGWWSPQAECAAGYRQAGHSLPGGRRGVRLALAPVLR